MWETLHLFVITNILSDTNTNKYKNHVDVDVDRVYGGRPKASMPA